MRSKLMYFEEATAYIGLGESFLRRLVRERRIRFYKVGRYLAFDRSDLDDFLTSQVTEPIRVTWRNGKVGVA